MWTERDDDDVIMRAKYQALLMQEDRLSRQHRWIQNGGHDM